jgi:hypothetical protein
MSDLQVLIEGIVTDLIKARFDADVKAVELAEHYRDHGLLRNLSVPTLNISNVTIDLKFAFDDSDLGLPGDPSDDEKVVIDAAATEMRTKISAMKSLSDKVTVKAQRTILAKQVESAFKSTAVQHLRASPKERSSQITSKITGSLATKSVRLSAAEKRQVALLIGNLERKLAVAPKPPMQLPKLRVGASALGGMEAEKVSTIRFDVDLNGARWTEIEDSSGETTMQLLDDR